MKSWETGLTGLGAILTALGSALQAQFDGDPNTVPNWGLVISLVIAGVGLLRARDNNKTSEDVGARAGSGITFPKVLGLALAFSLTFGVPVAVSVSQTGCAGIAQGSDPVVVNAERVANGALDILDAYVTLEKQNRELLWRTSYEFKGVADNIRENGLHWVSEVDRLKEAYKRNKTSENGAALQTAIDVLQAAIEETRRYTDLSNTKLPPAIPNH